MINCEKASEICNKKQYREASFLEQIKLGIHLLYCKTCATFSKRNKKLTILCEKGNLHSLSIAEKNAMREKMQNFI